MTIDKVNVPIEYDFWDKNLLQQTEVYMQLIVEEELQTHPNFSLFKQNYEKILGLLNERITKPDKDLFGFGPIVMARIIIYIICGVSAMGISQKELKFTTMSRDKVALIMSYFLNTIDILDWYRETPEYKKWKEQDEWRKTHPNYFKKPESAEEMRRLINYHRKRIKSGDFAKNQVLKYTKKK